MKKLYVIVLLFSLLQFSFESQAQKPENWTSSQLFDPSDLAMIINSKKDLPLIISVGPGAIIPNSIDIGAVNDPEALKKLKSYLAKKSTNKKIVIYCGCCPFDHCPNVRPAIEVLKEMKFSNYYLLNLPHNIKIDWIDKGYPTLK